MKREYSPEVFIEDTTVITEEEWLTYRKEGIGGSDVAALYGISPWKTARELYYEKIGREPVKEEEQNWVAKEVGHRLEELVVQIFAKKTGYKPYAIRKMFRHPEHGFMIADVDFFVQIEGKVYVVECKTTSQFGTGGWDDDCIPAHYELQGRHYVAVTNTDGVIFLCLFGNNENSFLMRRIERDYDQEDDIIAMEGHFWNEYVKKGEEPPYTEKADLVLQAIRRYAKPQAGEMEIPEELSQNVLDYLRYKEEKSATEKVKKEIEEKMKAAYAPIVEYLNGADKGRVTIGDSTYTVGFNRQERKSIGKDGLEKLSLAHPDIYSEYVKTNTIQTFGVKKSKKTA